jgi:hypothetical protein
VSEQAPEQSSPATAHVTWAQRWTQATGRAGNPVPSIATPRAVNAIHNTIEEESPAMPTYLIEVPHAPDKLACLRAVEIFLKTGSHYLTHCDWGCGDGEHKAWITIEADSKDDALRIIPPAFRAQAKIVQVGKFTLQQVESMLAQHTS